MNDALDMLVNLYGIRQPYESEIAFFRSRPEVSGMATEDNKIILNPFSRQSPEEQKAVARNEALRIYMKMNEVQPEFDLTPEQQKMFSGTEYEKDPLSAKRTMLSRILTGDPSAGMVTPEQSAFAQKFSSGIKNKSIEDINNIDLSILETIKKDMNKNGGMGVR